MLAVYVTAKQLSEAWNVSLETISRYTKDGLPRPGRNRFDIVACTRWRDAKREAEYQEKLNNLGREEQETRLKRIQAEKQEIIVAEMRGELVKIDQVREEYGRIVSAVRGRLLSLPATVAPLVIACKTAIEAQKVMDDAIWSALNELATRDLASPRAVATTPKVHHEPVGRRKADAKPRVKRRARPVANVKG